MKGADLMRPIIQFLVVNQYHISLQEITIPITKNPQSPIITNNQSAKQPICRTPPSLTLANRRLYKVCLKAIYPPIIRVAKCHRYGRYIVYKYWKVGVISVGDHGVL